MRYFIIILFCLFSTLVQSQEVLNPAFQKNLQSLLDESVPSISVKKLCQDSPEIYTLLDAREYEEYNISHIPNALYVGYDDFDIDRIKTVSYDEPIVVYCSVGYRSEKITNRLRKSGYKHVYNLVGSIFEWVNQGHPIEDQHDNPTKTLHTYNKEWSKWVDAPAIKKVW